MATDSAALEESAATDADAAAVDPESSAISVDDIDGLATADDSEAAAIAVAIAAHLRDRQAAGAAAADEDDDGEGRRSWTFAGRLEAIGEGSNRPPTETPTNGWTAAGRADRF